MNSSNINTITDETVIGKSVKYYDYLGFERFGKIVAIEPYVHPIYWIYIEDSDPDFNFYEDVVNGKVVSYGEIRPSDEVYIDE